MNVVELCLSHGHGGLEMYPHKVMRWLRDEDQPCVAVVRPGTRPCSPLENSRLFSRPGRRISCTSTWAKDLLLAVLAKRFCRRRVKLVYTRQMGVMSSKHGRYHRFVYRHVDRYIVITKRLQEGPAASGKAFADKHFSGPRHFEGLHTIFTSVLSE